MLPLECQNQPTTCPMCLGKGYCNEDKSRLSFSQEKSTLVHPKRSLRLPAINSENTKLKRHSSSYSSNFSATEGIGDVHLPKILHSNSVYTECSRTSLNQKSVLYPGGDNMKLQEKNYATAALNFERPQDALKLALLKLKENQWDNTMQALIDIVHISRLQPELIDSIMPIVNRSICSLLRNIRSNVVRTACQVAAELFRTMQCTQRPEFDELVGMLLQKTGDMNRCIRQDANSALDTMADFIPASHCVRVMSTSRGAGHKNPLVRATVSRLLNYIVTLKGVDTLFSTTATKDTRGRVFIMCAKFLVDGNCETRANARSLVKLLMTHSDFEHLFHQDVDRKLTEKIQKQLITLKYDAPSGSRIISK
ncbi:TOG array regulator of axonemal microtubules protein 2-like isoform X1 [Neodiprion pinetum]|uniref:TOG array regulator of axonemal microtubules protein 2-like isoform X1 n=1 Tax=Neodiprion pinetum TaxID=441929 RepID=UPI001EDFAED1|nr:uncharacterized protein LOC124217672 isoform X1 [Neodiprion pinetum]